MAKSQRGVYPSLPLSSAFYELVAQVGVQHGLDPTQRESLARAVAALSHTYTRGREGLAHGRLGQAAPLARLGFFLPRDLVKMFGPLAELSRAERLPARALLRVLDVGAGLGASSFGLARFLRLNSKVERLQVTAVERDAQSATLMRALSQALRELSAEFVPIELELQATELSRSDMRGPFDLVLLGFVLNELFLDAPAAERCERRAALLHSLSEKLAPDGALIVLEPALRESARELMQTRDVLVARPGPPHVFAPCVRQGLCPMLPRERDWCHESLDYALPEGLVTVARAAGLRFEGLSYAALVLTQTPRFNSEPDLVRIVSDKLVSKGKLELFGCGESGYRRLMRLDRDESAQNQAFGTLRRGDVVQLSGTRVTRDTQVLKRT